MVFDFTSLFRMVVGLGLRTIGENGVSLSSRAFLIFLDGAAGLNIEVKIVTSSSRLLLSFGCSRSFLIENWMFEDCSLISHSG